MKGHTILVAGNGEHAELLNGRVSGVERDCQVSRRDDRIIHHREELYPRGAQEEVQVPHLTRWWRRGGRPDNQVGAWLEQTLDRGVQRHCFRVGKAMMGPAQLTQLC